MSTCPSQANIALGSTCSPKGAFKKRCGILIRVFSFANPDFDVHKLTACCCCYVGVAMTKFDSYGLGSTPTTVIQYCFTRSFLRRISLVKINFFFPKGDGKSASFRQLSLLCTQPVQSDTIGGLVLGSAGVVA